MDYNIVNLVKSDFNFSKPKPPEQKKHGACLNVFIRFNIPLSASSVTNSSAIITSSKKNKVRTISSLTFRENEIKIKILDSLNENELYFITLGGNIRSLSGQLLSGKVQFRFTVKDGQATDLKLVTGKERVSTYLGGAKYKNANVEIIEKFELPKKTTKYTDKLPLIKSYSLFIVFFVILSSLAACAFFEIMEGVYFGIALALIQLSIILSKASTYKSKSISEYNKGARYYNMRNYEQAVFHFEKSMALDKSNITSRLALDNAFSRYINNI